MQLYIQNIHSDSEGDFSTQLHACIGHIRLCSGSLKISRRIVKITVFTSCSDNHDYQLMMNLLDDVFTKYDWCQAPVSLVSQPPVEGGTMMEVWMLDYSETEHSFAFSRGEQTIFPGDAARQTTTTLQIIDSFISFNNLNNNKICLNSQPAHVNYRVYLKNHSDYKPIKSLCDDYFGMKNGIFVKADICRSKLLVEIEANYRV